MTAIWTILGHIEPLSPVFFRVVLIEACVCSRIPIVCACFVDAWLIWISSICVFSVTTFYRNCEALSDKISARHIHVSRHDVNNSSSNCFCCNVLPWICKWVAREYINHDYNVLVSCGIRQIR